MDSKSYKNKGFGPAHARKYACDIATELGYDVGADDIEGALIYSEDGKIIVDPENIKNYLASVPRTLHTESINPLDETPALNPEGSNKMEQLNMDQYGNPIIAPATTAETTPEAATETGTELPADGAGEGAAESSKELTAEQVAAQAKKDEAKALKDAAKETRRLEAEAKKTAKAAETALKVEARKAESSARAEKYAARDAAAVARRAENIAKAEKDVVEAQARLDALLNLTSAPFQNGKRLPGVDSKGGKIWAIIDELRAADGVLPDRKLVIETALARGIEGESSIKSKFYGYRKYHGFTAAE